MSNQLFKLINLYSIFSEKDFSKIEFMFKNDRLIIELCNFREQSEYEAKQKAIHLANEYYKEFLTKRNIDPFFDKKNYLSYLDWVVTGFLFQSPYKEIKNKTAREIMFDLFQDWDANYFVKVFSVTTKELFKDVE